MTLFYHFNRGAIDTLFLNKETKDAFLSVGYNPSLYSGR